MTPDQRTAWIDKWAPAAQATQAKYGEPASVTLAQCVLESSDKFGNCGQSQCALQANNYFGIKACGTEPYIEFPTKEFKDGHPYMEQGAHFEKFATVEESFTRHGELIATEPRYHAAMEVCHDPVAFAAQLQACGYSTSPTYAQVLTSLIRRYGLAKYDALPGNPPEPPAQASAASTKIQEKAA
jgi:flagellum-specific peptidoglycan hydrolase FlgJ